jgi:hypothetical protein
MYRTEADRKTVEQGGDSLGTFKAEIPSLLEAHRPSCLLPF